MRETTAQRVYQDKVNAQANRLDYFLMLLHEIFQDLVRSDDGSAPHKLLLASLLRVKQAGRAVQVLTAESSVEEILAIGRTILEVAVNAVYLQHVDQREVVRYLEYQPQSMHQFGGLRQLGGGAGGGFGLIRTVRDFVAGTVPAVDGSGPVRTWTRRSLLERAQISDRASGVPVMALLVQRCYSRGHAAVHGTVGALGSFVRELNSPAAQERRGRLAELTEALFGINLCLMTLCIYLNAFFGLGMDDAIDDAANAGATRRPRLEGEAS